MKKSNYKKIPEFKNEEEEQDFWAVNDSADYIDWSKAVKNPVLSNLKPSMQTISLRLPKWMLIELKRVANKKDVPYQSLMKMILSEKLEEEVKKK